MSSGRQLYVTGNAGRDWARVPSPPTYGKGDPIWGFAMATTSSGWLEASATPCRAGPQDLCAVPVLLRTTDQGRILAHGAQPFSSHAGGLLISDYGRQPTDAAHGSATEITRSTTGSFTSVYGPRSTVTSARERLKAA